MEEKRNDLIEHLNRLSSNKNLTMGVDIIRYIMQIVCGIILLVTMIAGAVIVLKDPLNDPLFVKILTGIIIFVFIADAAYIAKSVFEMIFRIKNLSNIDLYYDQSDYNDLVKREKSIRKCILICDALSQFTTVLFTTVLGCFFILGGIYATSTSQSGDTIANIGIAIIFPVMGSVAIVAAIHPFAITIRELIHLDDISWNVVYENSINPKKSKLKAFLTMKNIKSIGFGLVFVLCGLLAFAEGISFWIDGDAGQGIGMSIFGLLFVGAGIFSTWIMTKK